MEKQSSGMIKAHCIKESIPPSRHGGKYSEEGVWLPMECFNSVQFKMVSMRSEKPVCAPPSLSEVSPTLPLKRFQFSSD